MPLNHRTPESLLGRSDSKNPSTTCRGITTNGRACRRSLASPKSSPAAPYRGQIKDGTGIVAIIQDDAGGLTDAAFYCWQHREQASNLTHQSYPQCTHSTLLPVQERTSIDSLVARLGVMAIDQGRGQQQKKLPPRSDQRRPAPSVPSDMHDPFVMPKGNSRRQPATDQHQQRNRPSFWASLCCMTQPDDEDDYFEVVHHKKRTNQYDGSQSPMGRPYPVADTPHDQQRVLVRDRHRYHETQANEDRVITSSLQQHQFVHRYPSFLCSPQINVFFNRHPRHNPSSH